MITMILISLHNSFLWTSVKVEIIPLRQFILARKIQNSNDINTNIFCLFKATRKQTKLLWPYPLFFLLLVLYLRNPHHNKVNRYIIRYILSLETIYHFRGCKRTDRLMSITRDQTRPTHSSAFFAQELDIDEEFDWQEMGSRTIFVDILFVTLIKANGWETRILQWSGKDSDSIPNDYRSVLYLLQWNRKNDVHWLR